MFFDQQMDVLLHCIIYAKTLSYDAVIQVSRLHELEASLQHALPAHYDVLIKEYGNFVDYFLKVQARGSKIYDKFFNYAHEGFQVMSQWDYYNDDRGFEPLCYNLDDARNTFVYVVLPYNKNHVLQDIKKNAEKKKLRKEKHQIKKDRHGGEQDVALEVEIMKLYISNAVKGQELEQRLDVKKRVFDMLNEIWPNKGLKVVIFGSSANGLGVDEGDLDLCITAPGRPPKRNERKHRMEIEDIYNMDFLGKHLARIGMLEINAINNAHVPIVRFRDPTTGLKVDLNANSQLGIENTRMIKQYTKLDSRVGPFLFAIKYFANQKRINQSANGTISSYAYYLLGLHYLMSVLKYPVIPSLQSLTMKCNDPIHCNYRNDMYVEGYDVRYHTCVEVETHTKYELRNPDGRFDEYTVWKGYNGDNLGFLIRDFFRWVSDINLLKQPKSIITNDGVPYKVDESMWWDDNLVIQDPFIIRKNIGYPCTEMGLETILHDFQVASERFDKESATFAQVCGLVTDVLMNE